MSAPHATGELVLATLYLEASEAREAQLRAAARALEAWDTALVALEAHGVLGLALRNLVRAHAEVPAAALAQLRARAEVMRAIDVGFQLTLERFVSAAAQAGVEVTLLKGASLALDLYPERGLRTQSDLDLLVAESDVPAAVRAAQRIGLSLAARAFPVWWYRLAHFHLKLVPLDALQRELELHWHLHPRAQLYTVQLCDLCARRTPLVVAGTRAWTLDPLDRLLHLVTHLARHCPLDLVERQTLTEWAADARVPLRLKWLVDIRAEIEQRHAAFAIEALARRAAEWNAEAELALAVRWLDERLGFTPPAQAWATRLCAALPARTRAPRRAALDRALPGLDLRPSALLAVPRSVWPRTADFGRLSGNGPRPVARRLGYAARALGNLALVAGATPVAWLARCFGCIDEVGALDPAETLALAARARELARTEHATSS